jgi:MFS family permease
MAVRSGRIGSGTFAPGALLTLLRDNRNYRYTWIGQVVSEVGDHFNNIAVFSLAVATTRSGLVVSGVMLSRAIPAMLIGPLAGVVLDRFNRKHIMIGSDLFRAVVAACFMFTVHSHSTWLLYVLSGLLMGASPFFTSGRSAILPSIATREELHTANSLTQTTGWTTLTIGTFLGGTSVAALGYNWAFAANAASFLVSALCISRLYLKGRGFVAPPRAAGETTVVRPWHEYREGLRYMKSVPLILGLLMINIGWATGGGAAQILFSVFGEIVFNRGPAGLGLVWGFAGVGLLCGGAFAYALGRHLSFQNYKRAVVVCYVIHGGSYILFSQARSFGWALFFIALSRAGVGVSSVLNMSQLLRIVPNAFRGRVFSTMDSFQWSVMMLSMAAAGVASEYYDPRLIGAVAGALSSTTAIFWGWAHFTGRLPEPAREGTDPDEVEVHEAKV